MKQKLVSIILPTYNRMQFLNRSINSVLEQSYSKWELLIIDDGSNDGTDSFVKKFINKFPQIRYFHRENRGAPNAMNLGISNTNGEYITFLGSDDEFMPNHLYQRIKFFEQHPGVDIIHSPAKIVGNEFVKDKNDMNNTIHLDDCIIGGTLFVKASVFDSLKGFKELKYSPESEFIERAEKEFRIKKYDLRSYIYYRNTFDSICNNI